MHRNKKGESPCVANGNRSKSDPCSYELFCLESHILSFPKVLQIPSEPPCIYEHFVYSEYILRTFST